MTRPSSASTVWGVEKRAKQRRGLLSARPILFAVGVAALVIVIAVVVLSAV